MEQIDINLFYPFLFITIGLFIIIGGVVIIKCKDSILFNNIFNRHVDEHIDTTGKFSIAHTEIVAGLPTIYHKEFHNLEQKAKEHDERIEKLEEKINTILNDT